eukprot:TRINITY_DN6192_c0_g1_i1.p1 TRINITY_DN6192_c0_g1~~TRINITY_DN6192_c0_g1_i1.p1  ORF type:complete len:207 (+),score=93.86 TRINITY_DN6192_c0_g1_i1:154-774(+)
MSTKTQANRPVVITGPSGVGKGTLINKLCKRYPNKFSFCVSHTTRAARPGEVDGKSYHFAEKEAMRASIDAGEFIEWAEVHGNLYGTSVSAVADASSHGIALLDIDVQGARAVYAKRTELNDPLFVFVKPPAIDSLRERLLARSTEDADTIETRVRNAEAEIEASGESFWNRVFVNDDLDECFERMYTFFEENFDLVAVESKEEEK